MLKQKLTINVASQPMIRRCGTHQAPRLTLVSVFALVVPLLLGVESYGAVPGSV